MQDYVDKQKGMVKPICANCKYAPLDKPENSDMWRCRLPREIMNHVTGKTISVQDKCVDKNSEGRCSDFKAK